MKRRVLSVLLAAMLLFGMLPSMAYSANAEGNYDVVYPIGNGALYFNSATGTIVAGNAQGSITIPSEIEGTPVVAIAPGAFRDALCEEIEVPDSVTEIGTRAFAGSKRLVKVRLPSGMKTIPEGLFRECSALKQVNIPETVTVIEKEAFYYCQSLVSVTLPPQLERIEESAFYVCQKLVKADIPASVRRIEKNAFAFCSLAEVDLPDGLTFLGYLAFKDYGNTETEDDVCYIDGWMVEALRSGDGTISVRDGTIGIAEGAIYYSNPVEMHPAWVYSVSIPASVRILDRDAFQGSVYINKVTISKRNPYFSTRDGMLCNKDGTKLIFCPRLFSAGNLVLPEGLKEIGPHAFSYYETLRRVVLPDSLESIGEGAFWGSGLKRVEFGSGLKTIGPRAFYDCQLTAVTLGDQVETIGEEAFYNCCLTRVRLGDALVSIGREAFANNRALKSVEFPASLEMVGEAAFFDCLSLAKVLFNGDAPEFAQAAFWYSMYPVEYEDYLMAWFAPNPTVTLYYLDGEGWDAVSGYKVEKWQDSTQQPFVDTPANAWYADAVSYVVQNGLMNGIENGKFDPEGSMTRAMLVTVLWRFAGDTRTFGTNFTDVKNGQWYTEAIGWAAQMGIVNGVSATEFDPEGMVTREQMVTILYRFSIFLALDTSAGGDLSGFADYQKISPYAFNAMQWAVSTGLVGGMKEANGMCLVPQGYATRAQVATILMRFLEKLV